MEELNLCKYCKHFYGDAEPPPFGCLPSIPKCLKTQIQEPVLGNFISQECIEVRSNGYKCGREGKWWEPKEEAGDMIAR